MPAWKAATSAGGGETNRTEWRSLFPSQRAQAGAESTSLQPEDWLSNSVSPCGVGINVPLIFIYLIFKIHYFSAKSKISVNVTGREEHPWYFSLLAFWSALMFCFVFFKGTKEKPHWDHNKSSVVLEEMRAYNLDEMCSGRCSMLKNPVTAEWQEHPGASSTVFSWLGMHVQLQRWSHHASRSPSPATHNKQLDDSKPFTRKTLLWEFVSRWGLKLSFVFFFLHCFLMQEFKGKPDTVFVCHKPRVVTWFSSSHLLEIVVPI